MQVCTLESCGGKTLTPAQRIHELTTRQRWDSSSMSVRLNSVKGKWHYNVILFVETDIKKPMKVGGKHGLCIQRKEPGETYVATVDRKDIVIQGKYNGEDPEELIAKAEAIVGKWQCGRQIRKPIDVNSFVSERLN